MEITAHQQTYFTPCPDCAGQGKAPKRTRKKIRLEKLAELNKLNQTPHQEPLITPAKEHLYKCLLCNGNGLMRSVTPAVINTQHYPHVTIVGGGIGGVALAVACLHRGIPFTLYERDNGFNDRSQGYGLTLQQASKAIEGFGIFALQQGVFSTRHVVHTIEGKIIGEWGVRKLNQPINQSSNKRRNVHIARQALRLALLEQLGGHNAVQWGHQLINFKNNDGGGVDLTFKLNGETQHAKADILVGADGIRSAVRKLLITDEATPLRYLNCIVILGICPLANLHEFEHSLLDSATVFQTSNGNERIYLMPYATNSIMWQLSFPMVEEEAKALSAQGTKALKAEAIRRLQWHDPIPQILAATAETEISGYPVYDRALLDPQLLANAGAVTLIGDAAHPMSPFKGQGANQALLDALALARAITKEDNSQSEWRDVGVRKSVLTEFELEILARSASKVNDSATAAHLLHSEIILKEVNEPRGRSKHLNAD